MVLPLSAVLPAWCLGTMVCALISDALVHTLVIAGACVDLDHGQSHPFAFRCRLILRMFQTHLRLGVRSNLTLGFLILGGPFLPPEGMSGS